MLTKIFPAILALLLTCSGALAAETLTITDMRGQQVEIPQPLERIATIDDGFVEGVMTHLGQIDKVIAIGSWSMKRDYHYEIEGANGQVYDYRGWNTMKYLHPWLDDLPCVNSPQGNVLSFETLAVADPQLVILRIGDCTVGAGNTEAIQMTINTIEALGFPLVVIYAPSYYSNSDLSSLREEGRVIGSIFGQEEQALALMDSLAATEALIRERTANIPEAERSKVLYLGLNPNIRLEGGAGSTSGLETPESYIIESIAGARNAFRGTGSYVILSTEQIYALDPDVILLPTSNGYHPPVELYESSYMQGLNELRAIQNQRVYAMPWSPMNCNRRVEYPIDLLIVAKAAYPDLFADINVYEFAADFYQRVYHVDRAQAEALRSHQLLDWMQDIGF